MWSAHRHLRLQPQSLRARGAKAARALLAATGGQASKLMTRWPSLLRPRAGQRRAQKRHGTRFRSAKPTLTVGFGFRVSGFDRPWGSYSLQSRFRVSGFGLRVSGFGFRSVLGKVSLQSRFRVSGFGFGFRSVLGKLSLQSRFRVSGFGFRVSLVETNSADLSPDHVSRNP